MNRSGWYRMTAGLSVLVGLMTLTMAIRVALAGEPAPGTMCLTHADAVFSSTFIPGTSDPRDPESYEPRDPTDPKFGVWCEVLDCGSTCRPFVEVVTQGVPPSGRIVNHHTCLCDDFQSWPNGPFDGEIVTNACALTAQVSFNLFQPTLPQFERYICAGSCPPESSCKIEQGTEIWVDGVLYSIDIMCMCE